MSVLTAYYSISLLIAKDISQVFVWDSVLSKYFALYNEIAASEMSAGLAQVWTTQRVES